MNPLLLVDAYKVHHTNMYPENMTKLYSNFTPRKSRLPGIENVVVFGLQHFIKEYLIKKFNEDFFGDRYDEGSSNARNYDFKRKIISEYKRHNQVDTKHIEDLWELGYLPIEIKALDEGTLCPIGVPLMTITNTHSDFGWLVNYLETLISCSLWQPITSATVAYEYKKILNKYALETTGSTEGVQWQAHDFSMRGMSSVESSILSGMGHLLSFTGTDSIPAIYQLESSYSAKALIGASVPATEHSVMCMGTKESEIETFRRLLNLYPTGILSVVSDTWDLWKVLTEYLPKLKEEIINRDGKLVIRPDSGDPVDIICGDRGHSWNKSNYKERKDKAGNYLVDYYGELDYNEGKSVSEVQYKGVIELLWDVFGGTVNEQGYKVLDSHIGAIYGDAITRDRAIEICERLKSKGFASTNIVFGVGSFTYQYNTRDTFGFAMKATYGEITHKYRPDNILKPENCYCDEDQGAGYTFHDEHGDCNNCKNYIESREIFKNPITDDGTKRSAKGLLSVGHDPNNNNKLVLFDQQTWDLEDTGYLTTVFKDGKLVKETTLDKIREHLNNTL